MQLAEVILQWVRGGYPITSVKLCNHFLYIICVYNKISPVHYNIQLLHLNEINEVLWSRVQQYWTRLRLIQYCCTLLHKTSYWSSSSVVIVLLHKALSYYNFQTSWKLWNFRKFLKVLKFYENLEFKKKLKF